MQHSKIFNSAVIVGALGYFVDIYDLLLFSIVRVPSLKDLGVAEPHLLNVGVLLLNSQMAGLLLGGILWGVFGDKKGRVSVLFGSIFLYSIANIANGYVQSISAYAIFRFLAGLGLAGELGAAITLVSEVMTQETRGYGTAVVASVGICGAIAAALIGEQFDWRTAYIIGGGLGLILLILRLKTLESKMFTSVAEKVTRRGDLTLLFSSRERILKYLSCICIGLPIWFVIGILVTFSPELSRSLGVTGPILGGKAIMYSYIGLAVGDLLSGFLSQWLKSRKKVIFIFQILTLFFILFYSFSSGLSQEQFYALCVGLGFAGGYWAVFVTNASEQFGTNLRATVATTVPNFVRGAVLPITFVFQFLKPSLGVIHAALAVGVFCMSISFIALIFLKESFGKDLNYIEEISTVGI